MTSNHLKPSIITYSTKNKALTPNFACQRFFSTPCDAFLPDHHDPIISNRPKDSLGPLVLPSGTDSKIFNRPVNEFCLTIGSNQSTNDSQDDNGLQDNSGFSLAPKSSFLRKSGLRNKTHQPMMVPSTSLLKKSGTSKDLFAQFGSLIPDQSVSAKLKPTARKLDYDSSDDDNENGNIPNNTDDPLKGLIPTKSMSFPESKLFQIQEPEYPFSEYKASLFSQMDNRTRFQRDYTTHDPIATTSSITIYKCRHAHDGQDYIIKCLDEDLTNENRLYDSCRLLNQLQGHNRTDSHEEGGNENLVRYYNAWREDDKLYIVFEFCTGGNLIQIMQASPEQAEPEIIKILTDISAALCPLHQQNIIHGHIKPENILLARSGRYKLSDVELANISYNIKLNHHGSDNNILEKAQHYFSPENEENNQETTNSSFSEKSDVFSLGLILSQLMLGVDLRNNTNTLKELKNNNFNEIEQLPKYSVKLKETVKKMLSRDPSDRPSAKELFEQYGPKTPRKVLVLEREHNSEIKGDIAKLRAQLVVKRKKST